MYINDLPDEVLMSWLLLFADDSKVSKVIAEERHSLQLQRDLHAMYLWSEKWLLKFHKDKLKVVTITSRNRTAEEREYFVGTMRVTRSTCEKDLGIHIDHKLSFKTHVDEKVKTAQRMMGAIRRSFRYLTADMFKLLYKSLVRVHLECSTVVWNPHTKEQIDQIEGVQRRATKMLPNMKDLSYEERLRTLELPTLMYRRMRGDMLEVFKLINDYYDSDVNLHLLTRNEMNTSITRGHSKALYQSHSRLDVRKHSFSQRVVTIWNKLPEHVVTAPSINAFKNRFDEHWKSCPIYYAVTPTAMSTYPCFEA